jgi:hypothetical protein
LPPHLPPEAVDAANDALVALHLEHAFLQALQVPHRQPAGVVSGGQVLALRRAGAKGAGPEPDPRLLAGGQHPQLGAVELQDLGNERLC